MDYRNLAEIDRKAIAAAARRIDRRGDFGRAPAWIQEALTFGDYVQVCGPRPGINPYNGYALSDRGRAEFGL